jgi:hypothetical protein
MSQPGNKLSRRTIFTGAATAGALGAATALLPRTGQPPTTATPPQPAPEGGGGYQVSDHVLKYYKTTRI